MWYNREYVSLSLDHGNVCSLFETHFNHRNYHLVVIFPCKRYELFNEYKDQNSTVDQQEVFILHAYHLAGESLMLA